MPKLGVVLAFGLTLVPIFAAMRGRLHSAVTYWALCGVILWLTGVALVLGDEHQGLLVLSHVAGPVSASLFLMGALRFSRRTDPGFIPAVGSAGALLTGLAFLGIDRAAAVGVEIAVSFPLLAGAAWVVNVHAWRSRARLPEKTLGGALIALAVVMPTDVAIRLYADPDRFMLPIWATLSFAIGFLTLASLTDRAAARSRRLTLELEARTAALDRERRTLRALLESSPMAIGLVDSQGDIRYLNQRAAEILGLGSAEDWTGRPMSQLTSVLRPRLEIERRAGLSLPELPGARRSTRREIRLDQGATVLDVTSHPVLGDGGMPEGRVWLGRDITEEKRVGERLAQAQRMETVGTLAGGIAHDFNNQLTAILGNIDLLLLSLPEEDARRRAAQAVERSALHCSELTQGLLTFARKRTLAVTRVPVELVIREVADLLRPSLRPGVELLTSVEKGTGAVFANIDDLRRVLMNLGVNARDAIGESGTLRIEARRLDANGREWVEIGVADDGIGMEEATRLHMFDPFFTTKEAGKGTGLGLSVSYGIVQTHGAEITAESAPGEGSRFRVRWPAAPQKRQAVASIARTESAARRTGGATVLLGEDDPEVRRAVRSMLESAGHRVLEAVDGPDAVRCFDAHGPEVDLVLMDLAMPGCSGVEALRRIHLGAPETPSILMTGNPDPFLDEIPEPGDLLLKPFASRDLVSRVDGALAQRPAPS